MNFTGCCWCDDHRQRLQSAPSSPLSRLLHDPRALVASQVVLSSSSGPDLCGGLHRVRRMRQEIDGPHGETVLLFIGTPVLKTLADMQAHKLFVSDFPPHDTSAEQMLVASAQQARS